VTFVLAEIFAPQPAERNTAPGGIGFASFHHEATGFCLGRTAAKTQGSAGSAALNVLPGTALNFFISQFKR